MSRRGPADRRGGISSGKRKKSIAEATDSKVQVFQHMPMDPRCVSKEFVERYTPLKILGQGTYGVVWEVSDNVTQKKLAMKILALDAQRVEDESTHLYGISSAFLCELQGLLHPECPYLVPLVDLFYVCSGSRLGQQAWFRDWLEGPAVATEEKVKPFVDGALGFLMLPLATQNMQQFDDQEPGFEALLTSACHVLHGLEYLHKTCGFMVISNPRTCFFSTGS